MSEDRLGEGGGGELINKKEDFSLDRLELLKTVGTGERMFSKCCFTSQETAENWIQVIHCSLTDLEILICWCFYLIWCDL